MYPLVLALHSLLRWVVLLSGLWALVANARGLSVWAREAVARRAGLVFVIALDLQLTVGLLLYAALSPITTAAMADMARALHHPAWRYWVAEHPAGMLLGVGLAHVGRVLARRPGPAGCRRGLVCYALALVVIAVATPWPAMPQGRPLLRF